MRSREGKLSSMAGHNHQQNNFTLGHWADRIIQVENLHKQTFLEEERYNHFIKTRCPKDRRELVASLSEFLGFLKDVDWPDTQNHLK